MRKPRLPVLVAHLKQKLTRRIEEFERFYPQNGQFELDRFGKLSLKKITAQPNPPQLKSLETALHKNMPERHLLDILGFVQHYTGFSRHFCPPGGNEPKIEQALEKYLLTVFSYGTNLGPTQLTKHLRSKLEDDHLAYLNRRHLDEAKLSAARTDIINGYARFELPRFWGDGSRVAADGTKFDLTSNNLMSEFHVRYGGYGGIMYHHISDTYIALFTHFISCGTWEGIYLLDLFSQNQSTIQPDTVHADTQGQNLPIFGLAYLMGIKLLPRIRHFSDLIFYRPDNTLKLYQVRLSNVQTLVGAGSVLR
jgi:AraC-like DNA-binding protein